MQGFQQKAIENISSAKILYDNQFYNASVNRSYYAIFHSAINALSINGYDIKRISHEATQALFAGELIKRKKLFPSKLKAYLNQLRVIRNAADYEPEQITQKIARRQLGKAQEFLEIVLKESTNVKS
jgi:uncharacterized protein (UPF0332 family)